MFNSFKKLLVRLPVVSQIKKRQVELEQRQAELDRRQAELDQRQVELERRVGLYQKQTELDRRQAEIENKESLINFYSLFSHYSDTRTTSVDEHPWAHPFLTTENLARFRAYSDQIGQFAFEYQAKHSRQLTCAFAVNVAQNMYKWACLAKKYGTKATLFSHAWDTIVISHPEWEEFDGEYQDVYDAEGFLKLNSDVKLRVPCNRIPIEGKDLYAAYQDFCHGNRKPLLHLLAKSPGLRHQTLMSYSYSFYDWSRALSDFDVVYCANVPLPAYFSGTPYCVFSVGADLQFDCGRADFHGKLITLSFNAAKFLLVSNPHTLGHCRRVGLTNGLYLPYPMDDSRYCPGEGQARKDWEAQYGPGIYVLTTSRLDDKVKGFDEAFFKTIVDLARRRLNLHFIFLAWGDSTAAFRSRIEAAGLSSRLTVLKPVGKKRLIDYYRSCDIVLDHFVYGYYGATTLEAASIGKPVVMKLREDHYGPLYKGDTAPVMNTTSPSEVSQALLRLIDDADFRKQRGTEMRNWLLRNHGEEKTVPLMLALLRLAADRVPLPKDLVNPLWDEESEAEKAYHAACLTPREST